MQDGEGFDDANQNLNGYWKLGKLEGPSYKIVFFFSHDFLELLKIMLFFFWGGVQFFFGVLTQHFLLQFQVFSKFEYFIT